mgnify:CR=1 FL=1
MALFVKISELPESAEKGYVVETVGGVSKKFDLNRLGENTQYSTMPDAAEHAGKGVQYIGETNAEYEKGRFYKSEPNGGGVYAWTSIAQTLEWDTF